MIPAQRRALVLDAIRSRGGASIVELARAVDASLSTIRRDLIYLTEQGYLDRHHGGAIARTAERTTFEPAHEIGSRIAHAAKAAIGERAARLIEDGQSVILDSSSTVHEAARRLAARQDLRVTVVTNDLNIAATLAPSAHIRLVVPGGTIRPGSFTLVGEPGQEFMNGLRVDLALIGTHSLAGQRLSDTSIEIAAIKRRMIAAARRAVVLADSSKFQHPAFCEVCRADEIDQVITDGELAEEHRLSLEALGVAVERVAVSAEAAA